jgi:hypothetical protein
MRLREMRRLALIRLIQMFDVKSQLQPWLGRSRFPARGGSRTVLNDAVNAFI